MSRSRYLAAAPAPLLLLLPVSLAELAINRVAVPMLRPMRGEPPAWHTALDYLGLFLFYFASLLAVVVAGLRVARALQDRGSRRAVLAVAPLALLALGGAWAVIVSANQALTLALEALLGCVVVAAAARGASWRWGSDRDGGIALAVVLVSAPILVHVAAVLGAQWIWGEETLEQMGAFPRSMAIALVIAGLASPYCLAPRPFVRSVMRFWPVLAALGVALCGAWMFRESYLVIARVLRLAVGFELQTTRADPNLTLYLLASATMTWTITSCALAARPQRQAVAVALGLLIAGGSSYSWPLHYLLLALGVTLLADLAVPVRAAEAALLGRDATGVVVDDTAWGRFVASVSAVLRRRFSSVHALTTRGSDGSTSTVFIGEAGGVAMRARIDREGGMVIGVDLAFGRDLEGVPVRATLVVASDDPALVADAPRAEPALPRGDGDGFATRFLCRGDEATLRRLFDARLRDRAATLLDGWVSYVDGRSLRYRHYPSRSSPVEPFLPLAELAQGVLPPGAGERALVVIELLLELAERAGLREEPPVGEAPRDGAAPPVTNEPRDAAVPPAVTDEPRDAAPEKGSS